VACSSIFCGSMRGSVCGHLDRFRDCQCDDLREVSIMNRFAAPLHLNKTGPTIDCNIPYNGDLKMTCERSRTLSQGY
jgi:hypothetical protein